MAEFWDTLGLLVSNLWTLLVLLLGLVFRWALVIAWVAWWLFAVDWKKAWPVLARGGWAPAVLLVIVTALAWSRLDATPTEQGDFWWRLAYVSGLAALALVCGWLQGVFGFELPEISVEPVGEHGPGTDHAVPTIREHELAHGGDHHH
jgi:hypothetical protein